MLPDRFCRRNAAVTILAEIKVSTFHERLIAERVPKSANYALFIPRNGDIMGR
jgi:hypothetical protein